MFKRHRGTAHNFCAVPLLLRIFYKNITIILHFENNVEKSNDIFYNKIIIGRQGEKNEKDNKYYLYNNFVTSIIYKWSYSY